MLTLGCSWAWARVLLGQQTGRRLQCSAVQNNTGQCHTLQEGVICATSPAHLLLLLLPLLLLLLLLQPFPWPPPQSARVHREGEGLEG